MSDIKRRLERLERRRALGPVTLIELMAALEDEDVAQAIEGRPVSPALEAAIEKAEREEQREQGGSNL